MIDCPVEELVPIPTGVEVPYKNVREKAAAACKAARLLSSEGYEDTPQDKKELQTSAAKILNSVARTGDATSGTTLYTTEGALFVDTLLKEFDMEVVQDAKRIRHYVTNKLIVETDNNDPRIRMAALTALGKITDVGLFTERSEVTVNNRSTAELENLLKDKLRVLMRGQDVVDAVEVDNTPTPVIERVDVSNRLNGL